MQAAQVAREHGQLGGHQDQPLAGIAALDGDHPRHRGGIVRVAAQTPDGFRRIGHDASAAHTAGGGANTGMGKAGQGVASGSTGEGGRGYRKGWAGTTGMHWAQLR